MRKFLLSLMLSMALAIGSAATVAASTARPYYDTVVGVETGQPTANTSPFAGYAFGQLPGPWTASVAHGNLPTTPGQTGAILTGGFALTTSSQGVVAGTFDYNPTGITMLGSSSDEDSGFCTQTYRIADTLTLVTKQGSGYFSATLTHYGFLVAGQCNVFFATVSGTIVLTF
jgi:hypothetical protein